MIDAALAGVPADDREAALGALLAACLDGAFDAERRVRVPAGVVGVSASRDGTVDELLRSARVRTGDLDATVDAAVHLHGDVPRGLALSYPPSGPATLSSDALLPDTLARIAERLEALARALPGTPLGAVARPPHERATIERWLDGGVATSDAATAADDVRRHAQERPRAPALAVGHERLDYAALDARVDAFADELARRGVSEAATVAVALDRSVDLVVALLALFRLGAAYVPIDPAYPVDRVRYVVDDSGAKLVLVDGSLAEGVLDRTVSTWNVAAEPPRAGSSSARADVVARGDRLAYVVYTSGSTGRPKGVEVTHAAVRNTIRCKVGRLRLAGDDVQAAVMSTAFDASIFELTMPLLAGAELIVATREELEDFASLGRLLEERNVTVLGATPPTWAGLLEAGHPLSARLRGLVGGEALPAELARRLAARCEVHVFYGLTETAISSTAFRVDDRAMGPSAPIGRPIPNVRARLVTPEGDDARVGDEAELWIGGVGLARGYRGQPDLTRARFVEHDGERFYRTGDRVRLRGDGELDFLGRYDGQVKIRGMRVEPGEVEALLLADARVAAATVVARVVEGEDQLVAYVVPRDGFALDAAHAELRRRLPAHMVPRAILVLDRLPLTPNGKVDHRALPAPDALVAADDVGDDGTVLTAVLATLAEVTGEAVGAADDLAGLGLDSIRRARVRQALRRRGIEVALVDILRAKSSAELAVRAERRGPPDARTLADPTGTRPLTMNQKFPMLTHLVNPGTGAWNCQIRLDLAGADEARLARAFEAVVARHGALRLRFRWRGERYPVQEIAEATRPDLTVTKVHDEGELRALAERELRTTFDVERAPLHRVVLARTERGVTLLFTYFSGIFDGWSSAIVVKDLLELDARLALGEPLDLAPPPHYFHHLDALARRDWTTARAFFADALRGYHLAPSIGKPPGGTEEERLVRDLEPALHDLFEALDDRPFRTSGVGSKTLDLGRARSEEVRAAARRLGVEASTVFQVAWALALMEAYRVDDILLGMVAANRPDYEAAVGKYTSLLPFRYRLGSTTSVGDLLRGAERHVAEVLAHEGMPGGIWVADLGIAPWQFPFESTFTYVNYVASSPRAATRAGVTVVASKQVDAGIPPAFGMVVIPGSSTTVRLEYNRDSGFGERLLDDLFFGYLDVLDAFTRVGPDEPATLVRAAAARQEGVDLALF